MNTELNAIQARVSEIVEREPWNRMADAVLVNLDHDGDGDEFLLIEVKLKPDPGMEDSEYETFLELVEEEVGLLDGRYPSVRFSEAA